MKHYFFHIKKTHKTNKKDLAFNYKIDDIFSMSNVLLAFY
jgi:hypothetical protein